LAGITRANPPPSASGAGVSPGLWRNPNFLKFWIGQTVSLLGDEVSVFALPLIAISTLDARAGEMALLAAAGRAPIVVFALLAGVVADRVRRRSLLVGTNLGRALLLGSIPVAASLGLLSMPYLYGVTIVATTLGLLFSVAYASFLPSLVPRTDLVESNSKLSFSRSVAQFAGPGLASLAVLSFSAPGAVALDALSFVVAAICIGLIGKRESRSSADAAPPAGESLLQQRLNIWREIGVGWRVIWSDNLLRTPLAALSTFNLFMNVLLVTYVLYLTRELGLAPGALGLVFALYALGGLASPLVVPRVTRRFGLGRVMMAGIACGGAMNLGVVVAAQVHVQGMPTVVLAVLGTASFFRGFSGSFYGINARSLQQAITPDRLQGRVSATSQFVIGCTGLLGALAGGVLGETAGALGTLTIGAGGTLLAVPWLFFSEVRGLREPPAARPDLTFADRG